MMVKNQLMEDAVGLYLQLGKDFPTVVVRDGKTGADYLTDLLTDRRLLPYLEPSRYPLPPRVKVEVGGPVNRGNMGSSFEVDVEGDLFPMYRRLRFAMDLVSSGNNTWTLALRSFHWRGTEPLRRLRPAHAIQPGELAILRGTSRGAATCCSSRSATGSIAATSPRRRNAGVRTSSATTSTSRPTRSSITATATSRYTSSTARGNRSATSPPSSPATSACSPATASKSPNRPRASNSGRAATSATSCKSTATPATS